MHPSPIKESFHKLRARCSRLLLIPIFLFTGLNGFNQISNPAYGDDIEKEIRAVEYGLSKELRPGIETENLHEAMQKRKIHGLSITVIQNYQVRWARGYGFADSAEKRPVGVQTLFQAASISKSLNALAILKLAQEKKLDLYADINKYLVSWKFPYDAKTNGKKITIANLLSHTAGLTVHGFPGYEPGEPIPSIIQILNGQKPANTPAIRSNAEPGIKSVYSGGGTTISQLIVTDLVHQPYATFMKEKVLSPLGMELSSYEQPPSPDRVPYLSDGFDEKGTMIKGHYHIYPEQAAAGLWTNPSELSKYILDTQKSLEGNSNLILDSGFTLLRLTPYIDSSAALGVFIITKGNSKYFSHNGANEGFRCLYIGSLKKGNGMVVMTNSDNGELLSMILNSVAREYKWDGVF